MSKYNIGNKSDMRKLQKDLLKAATNKAKAVAAEMDYDVECPHCGKDISVNEGYNICPFCNNTVTVDLDFNF